ncbi:hypothetical protein GVN18_11290 [Pseudomonas sp. ODNR1LW]|nr:hypothetical protein [Pseudomonas sp. ODNR1LW]
MNPIVQNGVVYTPYTDYRGVTAYVGFNTVTGQWQTLLDEVVVNGQRITITEPSYFWDPNADVENANWSSEDKSMQNMLRDAANKEIKYSDSGGSELLDELAQIQGQALSVSSLAALSQWIYDYNNPARSGSHSEIPDGFVLLGERSNSSSGFFGVAIMQQDTGDVVFVTRGTSPTELVDWYENLDIHAPDNSQAADMQQLVNEVLQLRNEGQDIYFTGHSLGGALSTVGLGFAQQAFGTERFNYTNVTFGSAPQSRYLSDWGLDREFVASNTVNFMRDSDPLDLGRSALVGTFVEMPTPASDLLKPFWENHDINKYKQETPSSPWGLSQSADDILELMRDPIFIDLDGDGVEMDDVDHGIARFDFDGDGFVDSSSWVTSDDAVLFVDMNNDLKITDSREVAFRELFGGATDLSTLATLDENQDGKISSEDSIYKILRLWHDSNGDGIQDQGEVGTLEMFGLVSISVGLNGDAFDIAGARVQNTTTVQWTSGHRTDAWDVALQTVDRVDFNNLQPDDHDALLAA